LPSAAAARVSACCHSSPYLAYLNELDSAESRATMKGCLDRIARILVPDRGVHECV
jgi:hypothetical protein